jgi:AbrB family looped-hinge helix DNA binding protein
MSDQIELAAGSEQRCTKLLGVLYQEQLPTKSLSIASMETSCRSIMAIVKVSPKYQVVIPQEIREVAGVRPGQEIDMVWYDNHIHLVRVPSLDEARGMAAGIDRRVEREPDRPL